MKARTFVLFFGLSATGLMPLGCMEQPELECKLPRGPFSARYDLVSGNPECQAAQNLHGEIVGVEQYYPEKDGKQDLSRSAIAIQGSKIGKPLEIRSKNYFQYDSSQRAYGYGEFASTTPSNETCTVPTLSLASIDLPEIPPTEATETTPADPGTPAANMQYQWSNLRFIMTDEINGTAFDADLTVTANGCTASYRVNAMFYYRPFLAGAYCAPASEDPFTYEPIFEGPPDDRLCDPQPVPEAGHVVGSGILPVFRTRCAPETNLCELVDDVEDYR